jgi:hypothetical protein
LQAIKTLSGSVAVGRLFLKTSAQNGGWWLPPRPCRVNAGRDPVHTVEKAGWDPKLIWMGTEDFAPHWGSKHRSSSTVSRGIQSIVKRSILKKICTENHVHHSEQATSNFWIMSLFHTVNRCSPQIFPSPPEEEPSCMKPFTGQKQICSWKRNSDSSKLLLLTFIYTVITLNHSVFRGFGIFRGIQNSTYSIFHGTMPGKRRRRWKSRRTRNTMYY